MNLHLLMIIAIPFAAGLLTIFPGRFIKVLRWALGILAAIASGVLLVMQMLAPKATGFSLWKLMSSKAAVQFMPSHITLLLALVFVFIYLMILLYSIGFYSKKQNADTELHALGLFILGSALGLLFSKDFIFIFLFWEIAAFSAWRLIGFGRSVEKIAVANRTLMINFFGSTLMMVGILILVAQFNSFSLSDMLGQNLPVGAGILILAGIFAKSAVIPLYIWVPSAYAEAPTPVVAILAGIVENFGLILFFKVFVQTFTSNAAPVWHITLLWIALVSTLVAAGTALIVRDYRRILGYSTISQLAFVLAGFAVVSLIATVKPVTGLIGAVLFIIAHGIGKTTLLLGYGTLEKELKTREILGKGRLIMRYPLLFAAIMIASLSIMGLPPLFGFFAKFDVLYGILLPERIILATGFIIASVFTLFYLLRLFTTVFLKGETPKETNSPKPIYLSLIVFITSLALLAGSFVIKPLIAYLGG